MWFIVRPWASREVSEVAVGAGHCVLVSSCGRAFGYGCNARPDLIDAHNHGDCLLWNTWPTLNCKHIAIAGVSSASVARTACWKLQRWKNQRLWPLSTLLNALHSSLSLTEEIWEKGSKHRFIQFERVSIVARVPLPHKVKNLSNIPKASSLFNACVCVWLVLVFFVAHFQLWLI